VFTVAPPPSVEQAAFSPCGQVATTPQIHYNPRVTGLHERQVVQLLLVRAAEEHDPALFTSDVLVDAALASLDARDDLELLEKRSAYLALRLPKTLKGLAHAALLPEDRIGSWLALAVLAGMLSNYLGPSGLVHVAYNPLTFLLAWNLIVFGSLAWTGLRRKGVPVSFESAPSGHAAVPPPGKVEGATGTASVHRDGIGRWILADAYLKWVAWRARHEGAREKSGNAGATAAAFSQAYWAAAAPVIVARLETLVHVAAVGVLAGALAGTYLRGLFFEYNAVWRSTFLIEPSSVAAFLNLLLGPASLLIDGQWFDADTVAPLLRPSGDIAGPWIHKLALMAALVIVPPRLVLAVRSARRARAAARCIRIDFTETYYAERIASVREGLGHRIRDGIATAFRLEVAKLSESVALFVRERFFDKAVAPSLVAFRNRGGQVRELEAELESATGRFTPELSEHLLEGQRELQRALAARVRAVIGREHRTASDSLAAAAPTSISLEQGVAASVAGSVGDAIGASITAAVAAAVATVSGGVGKTLGVALLSGLFGVSGPIGLLLGGAGAVAVVGGAYVLGRERLTETIKGWSIPASIVSLALRDGKIEEARQATYLSVRREIEESLEPRIPEVIESIVREIPLAVESWSTPATP